MRLLLLVLLLFCLCLVRTQCHSSLGLCIDPLPAYGGSAAFASWEDGRSGLSWSSGGETEEGDRCDGVSRDREDVQNREEAALGPKAAKICRLVRGGCARANDRSDARGDGSDSVDVDGFLDPVIHVARGGGEVVYHEQPRGWPWRRRQRGPRQYLQEKRQEQLEWEKEHSPEQHQDYQQQPRQHEPQHKSQHAQQRQQQQHQLMVQQQQHQQEVVVEQQHELPGRLEKSTRSLGLLRAIRDIIDWLTHLLTLGSVRRARGRSGTGTTKAKKKKAASEVESQRTVSKAVPSKYMPLLAELRRQVEPLETRAALVKHALTDVTLGRYLENAYWDPAPKGKKTVLETIEYTIRWRETFRPQDLTAAYIKQMPDAQAGALYVHGHDLCLRPVVYFSPGLIKDFDRRKGAELLTYTLERATANMPSDCEEYTFVIDCQGWGLHHFPPVGYIRHIFSLLMAHYPMRLGHVVLINFGTTMSLVWRIVSPLVTDRTKRKMKFVPVGSEKTRLLDFIASEMLPRKFRREEDCTAEKEDSSRGGAATAEAEEKGWKWRRRKLSGKVTTLASLAVHRRTTSDDATSYSTAVDFDAERYFSADVHRHYHEGRWAKEEKESKLKGWFHQKKKKEKIE